MKTGPENSRTCENAGRGRLKGLRGRQSTAAFASWEADPCAGRSRDVQGQAGFLRGCTAVLRWADAERFFV